MPDIRQRVEEDRGTLKKIQEFVPGFRGYRRREDLRDADRILRAQVSQKLSMHRRSLEDARSLIVNSYGSKELVLLGGTINQFKKVEEEITHAEMGYSGLVAAIEIHEAELDKLYEYDASMIDIIAAMSTAVDNLRTDLTAKDPIKSQNDILLIKKQVGDLEDQFKKRMVAITNTEV